MIPNSDKSTPIFAAASVVFFMIGGLLTTVVPPMVDTTWGRPFENSDPAKGPTGKLQPLNEQQLQGRAIYVREGCWYCHTQQTRTLLADTKRSGWRGVDSPISTPDEFVYDNPHMFGTKRTGPDLSRVGGKYDMQWHRTHFKNPRDLVQGSIMPPYPWIANNEQEFQAIVAYLQTLGRAKNWRPDNDFER
ncbi:MAG: cbb3-type cytochrome c oxidase subunit II [Bryobacterales bacterium]|nr:cbb3-type cytochrome c oxidase subunit II [Bryobacterales bacterium]